MAGKQDLIRLQGFNLDRILMLGGIAARGDNHLMCLNDCRIQGYILSKEGLIKGDLDNYCPKSHKGVFNRKGPCRQIFKFIIPLFIRYYPFT